MSKDTIQWLIQQTNDGQWEKDDVYHALMTLNKEGKPIFSTLPDKQQQQIFLWNKSASLKVVHWMSEETVLWLHKQARIGEWNLEDVQKALVNGKRKGKHLISFIPEEEQHQVLRSNKRETLKNIHLMSQENVSWLLQETANGEWNTNDVHRALMTSKGKPRISTISHKQRQEVFQWDQKGTLDKISLMSEEDLLWLIQQTEDGHWIKNYVYKALMEKNVSGACIISILPHQQQEQVLQWNLTETLWKIHLLSRKNVQWLVQQAINGHRALKKQAVFSRLMDENKEGEALITTIPGYQQVEVFQWNKEETLKRIHLLSKENLTWLVLQTADSHWSKKEVFDALTKAQTTGSDRDNKITEALALLMEKD